MRIAIALMVCGVGLLSAGCSSLRLGKADPPPVAAMAAPPPGWAQICVMRPHWVAPSATLAVYDNRMLVGATRGDTYFCFLAGAGWHQLTTEIDEPGAMQDPQSVVFSVAAGQRLYLHHHMQAFGVWSVEWVDEATASAMIDKCGYRVVTRAANDAPPPLVPAVPGALSPPAPPT